MSKRLKAQTPKSPFAEILVQHAKPKPMRVVAHVTEPEPVIQHVVVEYSDAPPAAIADDRKRGKSADPGYVKLTAYIRKTTHNAVKIRLLQEAQDQDFSELVETLLQSWLNTEANHG
jgi:hypothetical protein